MGVTALLASRRKQRAPSPAALAKRLDPRFVITPTIALLDDVCVRSFNDDDQRDCVSTPPRTGKSQLAVVWNMVWMLMMNPDLFIIVTAYGDSLAEEHSRKARTIITEHSAYLGYQISQDKTAVKRWNVDGRKGGVLAVGIQSGITGVGADHMLIDDPLKDQADADSPLVRKKILGEYQSTLAPRVHPSASITVIQCIVGSMRVMTSDGRWIAIKDVVPGDRVSCVDPTTGVMTAGDVSAQRMSGHDETMLVRTDRNDLRVNARHPFAVLKKAGARCDPRVIEWRRAEDLEVGDVVVTAKAATELPTKAPVVTLPTDFVSSARRSKVPGVPHSDMPGVSWNSAKQQWKVALKVQGESRFGGYFDAQADAEAQAKFLRADMTEAHVIDVERAWLIGYMIGDGWVTLHHRKNQVGAPLNGCVCIAMSDKPHFDERAWKELQRWSPNKVYETKVGYMRTDWNNGARILAEIFGLNKGAKGKRVPDVVWSWPVEHRRAFLEGYCHADGSRTRGMETGWRVASVSRGLIEDVRLLSLTCGVRPARICTQRGTYQPPNSPAPIESVAYTVLLAFDMERAEGDSLLIQKTGSKQHGKSGVRGVLYDKRNPLRPWHAKVEFQGKVHSAGYFATVEEAETAVIAKRAEVMGDEPPRVTLDGKPIHPDPEHIRYERIREIVRDGEMHDVYDITVEGHGNFVAEGFVVHNTRWHESDLVGELLKREPEVWRHTNIPAVSEVGVPDALGREPGVTMTSALGYTEAHYRAMRRTSGERTWYSLYQGVPTNPEGSLVKAEWFEDHRLSAQAVALRNPVLTVVSIDPAESGRGDECGLVASCRMTDGRIALIADRSAQMTSDEWAVAAVKLTIEVGASQIAVEGFTARETYSRMVRDALDRARTRGELKHAVRVTAWPEKGKPRPGDALARSGPLLQGLETGTAVLAGRFPELENAATTWQAGQHQPDRLAAWVVGHDVLVGSVGKQWDIAGPDDLPATAGSAAAGGSVTALSDWMSQRAG